MTIKDHICKTSIYEKLQLDGEIISNEELEIIKESLSNIKEVIIIDKQKMFSKINSILITFTTSSSLNGDKFFYGYFKIMKITKLKDSYFVSLGWRTYDEYSQYLEFNTIEQMSEYLKKYINYNYIE
jgi:hypothetical protein